MIVRARSPGFSGGRPPSRLTRLAGRTRFVWERRSAMESPATAAPDPGGKSAEESPPGDDRERRKRELIRAARERAAVATASDPAPDPVGPDPTPDPTPAPASRVRNKTEPTGFA